MKRFVSLCLLAIALLALPDHTGAAQAADRCFAETGFCVAGRLREFWERNGGLPVFGLPLTEQRDEMSRETGQPYQTQWFERVRMELHPENARPYDVLLGRIGDDRLRQTGRDWQTFPREAPQESCQFFAQTGFNVCGELLRAWHANGLEFDGRPDVSESESLALYGAPLSPVMTEIIEGRPYQTQWFERARLELHPENAPPYNVLLGRLAAETRDIALAAPGPHVLLAGTGLQLYRSNTDGSGLTRLPLADGLRAGSQSTIEFGEVAVSPDGGQIAAIVRIQASPTSPALSALMLANRDASFARVLTRTAADYELAMPAWSPDGRQIAFAQYVAGDNRYHIFLASADGSDVRQLTYGATNDVAPRWSPNGRTIAFLSDPNATYPSLGGQYLLAVVPSGGGQPRGIASPTTNTFQWAPGGNELVFTAAIDGRAQIVALDPGIPAQRTLVSEDVNLFDMALSPDGGRIAYYRCCSAYNSQLVVRDFRTGQVATIGYARGTPRWSPDGQFLAVAEDQRVRIVGAIYRADGGGRVGTTSAIVGWLP